MIFVRAAHDLLLLSSALDPSIAPGVNAFASGLQPAIGSTAPLRAWFFSEGATEIMRSSNSNGIFRIEVQILLRGARNKRRETDLALNVLADLLYQRRGFTGSSGAEYSGVSPAGVSPRPIDLGTDDTDSELSSLTVLLWQNY